MKNSTPDWSEIFKKRPDLESPGYQETAEAVRLKKDAEARENLANQMQKINKEKQSQRNKNRNRSATSRGSGAPNPVDPLLGMGKGRGKKR